MKYLIALILSIFFLGCGSMPSGLDGSLPTLDSGSERNGDSPQQAVQPTDAVVFTSTDVAVYRLPSIVRLLDGRIMVFAEKRDAIPDNSHADIVYKVVGTDGEVSAEMTFPQSSTRIHSNPQPIVLPNGEILLFYNNRKANTSGPELCRREADLKRYAMKASQADLHFTLYKPKWSVNNTGPQLISPTQGYWVPHPDSAQGRIYAPTFFLGNETDCKARTHRLDRAQIMVSRDMGESFTADAVGQNINGTNETSITFDPDFYLGHIYQHSRYYGDEVFHRLVTITSPGFVSDQITEAAPLVHGGSTMLNGAVYFSYPNATTRKNLVVMNKDTGVMVNVTNGPAGYSNMIPVDGFIAVVYETGEKDPLAYEEIRLKYLGAF